MWIAIEHSLRFEYDAFIHESWMELRMIWPAYLLKIRPNGSTNRIRKMAMTRA